MSDVNTVINPATEQAIAGVVECLHYYAGVVDKIRGETIPVEGGIDMTFREPLGVVVVIAPWNFPLPIASWNIAPALAAANSVVVKPADQTPLSTRRFGELVAGLNLPEKLVQVVSGPGRTVGRVLVSAAHRENVTSFLTDDLDAVVAGETPDGRGGDGAWRT